MDAEEPEVVGVGFLVEGIAGLASLFDFVVVAAAVAATVAPPTANSANCNL